MKKLILLFCNTMLLCSFQSIAQLNYFTAEGNNYYDITNAVPKSNVEFYSERSGGRLLKSATVDDQGQLLLKTDKDFHPAFVLNRTNQKIPGTGKVNYIGEREFLFDNVATHNNNGMINLSWDAAIKSRENILFEVLKSNDGVHYKSIAVLNAQNTDNTIPYNVNDKSEGVALYTIKVINTQTGLRYTSKVISDLTGDAIKIYPTTATNSINIAISKDAINGSYRIINELGQLVSSGKLNSLINTLNVDNLTSGNYIVIVNSQQGNYSGKFIKM